MCNLVPDLLVMDINMAGINKASKQAKPNSAKMNGI